MSYIVQQWDFLWYLVLNWISGIAGRFSTYTGHWGLAHLIAGKLKRRLPGDLANYTQVIVSVDPEGQAMVTTVVVFDKDLEKAKRTFEREYGVTVIHFESMNKMLQEAVAAITLGEEKYI